MLEEVRTLLNTWWIPNDTRIPRDDLADWFSSHRTLLAHRASTRRFREELREGIEQPSRFDAIANRWIRRHRVVPLVAQAELNLSADATPAGELAIIVLEEIAAGRFERLKACPDCRWVFYDNTRNGSKRWCMMNSSTPGGRGCGNIAKARRYRSRHRGSE